MSAGRVLAWLQLARASNFPTVVSNALTGCALGGAAVTVAENRAPYPWAAFGLAAPALVLIYAAGMAFNDFLDAAIDQRERPGRPIPSGRISRTGALVLAGIATIAALALLAAAGSPALGAGAVLVVCAALYNLTHHLHPASVVLMGACRALALVTGATAAGWPPDWTRLVPIAAILWLYVIGLSIIARREAGSPRRIRLVILMVCAISLLDAAFLGALLRWPHALLAIACFLVAAGAQRRILGS
jgi:4-hydroxybenzoate polyprenyltransferase